MKKVSLLLIFILLVSCSNLDYLHDQEIYNSTGFDVTITQDPRFVSRGYEDYSYTIKSGERITVNTRSKIFVTALVSPIQNTDLLFSIDFKNEDFIIESFKYWVNYKISGTAKKADLTYSTSGGGTGQISVSLPYNVTFRTPFKEEFFYVSAQNDDTGVLKVQVYKKDKLISSDQCSGFACIATASN